MLRSYQPMLPVLIKLFIDSDYSCIVILIFFKFFEFNLSTIFFFRIMGSNFIPVIEEALYRGKVTMRTKSFINYYKVNVFLVFVFALFCISNDFYLVLEKLFVNTNTQTRARLHDSPFQNPPLKANQSTRFLMSLICQ